MRLPNVELYDTQLNAIERMHNGCVLVGLVGSGKSRSALAYAYTKELQGTLKVNGKGKWTPPKVNKDIYILTTAKKRDSREWQQELVPFGLSDDPELSVNHIKVTIDSWNNIKHYSNVYGAVFILDEQRIAGKGVWSKTFIRISRRNRWILLSGTPADNYSDMIPLLIANGYVKNRTDFNQKFVIFKPYMNYPCIDHYVHTGILNKWKSEMFVYMDSKRTIPKNKYNVTCLYDKEKYKLIWKERWNPYDECPIEETGKLFYLMRLVVNTDPSRFVQLKKILDLKKKVIIFYNFTPELHMLREQCKAWGFKVAEWDGEKHEKLPSGDKWVYLCQYLAAAEGWSCTTTDTIVFFSLNYSYKTMVQAAGRVDRTNTPFKELYYYYFQSYAPIDLAIKKALKLKKNFNERTFIQSKGH